MGIESSDQNVRTTADINRASSWRRTKWATAILLVCLIASLSSVPQIVRAAALIGAVIAGWWVIYYGSEVAVTRLSGASRLIFKVAIAVLFPLVLSMYFLKNTPHPTFTGIFGGKLNIYFLIALAVIGWISWAIAEHRTKTHDQNLRLFLIAAVVLFVISFMGYNGVDIGTDDELSGGYGDSEYIADSKATGRFFGQFMLYVCVSYAGLLIGIRQARRIK